MDRDALIRILRNLIPPGGVSVAPADLAAASRDESDLPPVMPVCVCRPQNTAEVVAIVRVAAENGIPVTPRGGGSSLEGSSIPAPGAIVLEFGRMDRVHAVSAEERLALVQPGVVHDRLNRQLRPSGLCFPPSPGGSGDVATIGGMVATDASGIYSLRHGGTRRWVRQLEVVTGNAQVVRVGSRVPKTSAGFDLKDLFVGSEGTLGVITEVALALAPVPAGTAKATLAFSTLSDACAAAAEMAAYVPELAAVEVADRDTMDCLRALPGLRDLPAGDVLFIETHGRPDDCAAGIEAACGVAAVHGGATVAGIDDPWAARHRMTRTIREAAGAAGVARTDCAVPLPALSRFVHEAKARVASDRNRTSGGQRRLYVFGHAGVGIVHCLMPLGGAGAWTPDEARIEKSALAARAVALGGTVTGEHGIGLGHRDSLRIEHPDGVGYMRRIKSVFDPLGIMNPDKVF